MIYGELYNYIISYSMQILLGSSILREVAFQNFSNIFQSLSVSPFQSKYSIQTLGYTNTHNNNKLDGCPTFRIYYSIIVQQ